MDYSAANLGLWDPLIQISIIAATLLIATIIRRRVPIVKQSLLPTAVIAGFLALLLKLSHVLPVDVPFMEAVTYHCIAIGFIAMSLRHPEEGEIAAGRHVGMRSGAIIVSSYLIQGVAGLLISIGLSYTIMPGLFKASGILLPLAFGQGPGQANNTGSTYEFNWGFTGGRSYGLALAAMGYICACIVGIFILNLLVRRGKIKRIDHDELSGSVTVDTFQAENELPVSESIDRFSIQACLVVAVYLVTFLVTKAITGALSAYAPGVGKLVNSLLWGFNFIVGSAFAMLVRIVLRELSEKQIIHHRFQNNYLLSRISGAAFDVMVVAGISSIEPEELTGLILPFILMTIAGAVVTYFHLDFVSRRVYTDYYYEGLISMYGMMTGTISSGVLLLREIDPQMKTPAANNLVVGSSFGILFGIPMLILIGLAPKSNLFLFLTLAALIIYYILLLFVAVGGTKEKK